MKFAVAGFVVASSALLAGCAVYPDGTPAYGGGYPAAGYDPGYDPYGYGGPVVQSGVYVGGGSYYGGPAYYGGPPPRRYWDDGPGNRHPSQGGWQGQGRPPGDNGHGGNHGGPPPGQQAGGGNHGGPPPGQQAGGGGSGNHGGPGGPQAGGGRPPPVAVGGPAPSRPTVQAPSNQGNGGHGSQRWPGGQPTGG
jgi:hypothetical protein